MFHPPGKTVTVKTLATKCDQCGAETVLASQHEENLARLKAREAEYGLYLTGEAICAFRRKYGLTQQAVAKVFGKGLIAFSRYENEKSYPDESTTKLLRIAISRPDVLKQLADESGVEIPLWNERSLEVAAKKVSKLRPVESSLRRVETRHVAEPDTAASEHVPSFEPQYCYS